MSDTIITVENLGKKYRIRHERERYTALRDVIARKASAPFRRLRSARPRDDGTTGQHDYTTSPVVSGQLSGSPRTEEFWALKDVSFEVRQGEVLGIIGRNGAGKTTLLKILSRITDPTEGRVRIRGRVASLLEVGTGFHPELTGRENIFLNGAILGMSRAEIRKKFDEIVAFAETEKFLDTPVKRYSSGMYVRLAFAVAAHLEPEILLVDEVLAVGDAEFQKKCLGKMQNVAQGGRTIFFVSHNMAAIKRLCSVVKVFDRGRLIFSEQPQVAVTKYLGAIATSCNDRLENRSDRLGNGEFRWVAVRFLDHDKTPVEQITSGESLTVEAHYRTTEKINHKSMIVVMSFWDENRNLVAMFASDEMGTTFEPLAFSGLIRLQVPHFLLRAGVYSLTLFASHHSTRREDWYDSVDDACSLVVSPGDFWQSGATNRPGSYALIPSLFESER